MRLGTGEQLLLCFQPHVLVRGRQRGGFDLGELVTQQIDLPGT